MTVLTPDISCSFTSNEPQTLGVVRFPQEQEFTLNMSTGTAFVSPKRRIYDSRNIQLCERYFQTINDKSLVNLGDDVDGALVPHYLEAYVRIVSDDI